MASRFAVSVVEGEGQESQTSPRQSPVPKGEPGAPGTTPSMDYLTVNSSADNENRNQLTVTSVTSNLRLYEVLMRVDDH